MNTLMPLLVERGVKVGIATSVRKKDWENAMIFPDQRSEELIITQEQTQMLQLFDTPIQSIISGYSFQKVCNLEPVKDESGDIYEYKPHLRYDNRKGLKVHSYGYGPFCSFRIPPKYKGKSGVYAYRVNGKVVYIGKTEDLGERFNQGYGNISPRNCYEGGKQTNCRINNLVLEQTKNGYPVELHFFETVELDAVESSLITLKKPQWNKKIPQPPTTPPTPKKPNKTRYAGKYKKIGEYLRSLDSDSETLTYTELETILGFELPDSAYSYNAWWSNHGHNHSYAWLDFGWRFDRVSLKNWIRFRKEES